MRHRRPTSSEVRESWPFGFPARPWQTFGQCMRKILAAPFIFAAAATAILALVAPRSPWRVTGESREGERRPAASLKSEEPVRIQIGGEPSTLDPAKVIDQFGFSILRNLVLGLTKLDRDGKLQDGLAVSHAVDKTGLIYRFKLRPDARWSDGKPVTADDFVTGLRYALSPKTASPNTPYYFKIKNARQVFSGKLAADKLGVRREGDELVIELEQPDPGLLRALSLPAAGPLRQDFLDKNKGEWNEKAPTTGDYTIAVYHPASEIRLAPNPHRRRPGQRPILYRILQEEVTAMNLFEAGRLDIITTITPTEIDRLRKKDLIRTVPSTTVFYFSFNHASAPFNDIDWRRAIAGSIDREGLTKLLNGIYLPQTSYVPKPLEGALGYHPLEFKEAAAKVRASPKKPRVRLAYGASALTKIVGEKVQSDLKKKLGLEVTLEPMELKTLLARLKSDPPEMYFLGMSGMYDDPLNHLEAFSNVVEPNFSRYGSDEYEKLMEGVRGTAQGPERDRIARAANQLLVEKDIALVPAVLRLQVFAVNRELAGFHASPYQVIQLNELR